MAALSASDMAALTALGNVQGQYDWSGLLGQVTLGTPAAGTPTLAEQGLTGLTNLGDPILNAEQALGDVLGQPTLQQQEAFGSGPTQYQTPSGWKSAAEVLSMDPAAQAAFVDHFLNLKGLPVLGSPDATWKVNGPAQMTQAVQEALNEMNALPPELGATRAGQPTLAATTQGEKNAIDVGGLTGFYVPYNADGSSGGSSTGATAGSPQGQATLEEQKLQAGSGLDTLKLLSTLSGPANAFQQQAVLHGLGPTGLSNAVGAIQGLYGLPRFTAPQANPQAQTLQSLMDQVGGASSNWVGAPGSAAQGPASTPYGRPQMGAGSGRIPGEGPVLDGTQGADGSFTVNPADGGTTVFGGTHIHLPTNAAGAPSTLDPTTAAYVNSLPAPNKINGPVWMQLDKPTQDFLTSAYGAAGYSPDQITGAVAAGLPQFKAPAANPGAGGGSVAPSGQLVG